MAVVAVVMVVPARTIVVAGPVVWISAVVIARIAIIPVVAGIAVVVAVVMVTIGVREDRSRGDADRNSTPFSSAVGLCALARSGEQEQHGRESGNDVHKTEFHCNPPWFCCGGSCVRPLDFELGSVSLR